jgi:3-oxoacyl-[acyl-carrier protein] reductase
VCVWDVLLDGGSRQSLAGDVGRADGGWSRWGQPPNIAKIVSWMVSPDSSWITGQVIDAEGGFRR